MKVSLADALLGRDRDATSSLHEDVPQYLSDVSRRIFRKADTDHDGTLSTMEILRVLRKRAKINKTALPGIAFRFKETLHAQAEHAHDITEVEFERGLVVAMREDDQGPIAQWILRELQDLAAGWEPVELEGKIFYAHPTLGTSRTKPELVTAMEHFEQLRSEAESGGSAAEGGGSAVPPSSPKTKRFPTVIIDEASSTMQSGGGGEVPNSSSKSSTSGSRGSSSSSSGEEDGI